MITLDVTLVNFAIAVLLPMITALVTSRVASDAIKAVVLALLSAVGGVLSAALIADGSLEWKPAVISAVMVFITAVGSHYGLLKNVGITGSNGAIQKVVPKGIGGNKVKHTVV